LFNQRICAGEQGCTIHAATLVKNAGPSEARPIAASEVFDLRLLRRKIFCR
jgi:hypothetical protein